MVKGIHKLDPFFQVLLRWGCIESCKQSCEKHFRDERVCADEIVDCDSHNFLRDFSPSISGERSRMMRITQFFAINRSRLTTNKRFPNCFSRLVVFRAVNSRLDAHFQDSIGHMFERIVYHTHGRNLLTHELLSHSLESPKISSAKLRKRLPFITTPQSPFRSLERQKKLLLTFPAFSIFTLYLNIKECQKL